MVKSVNGNLAKDQETLEKDLEFFNRPIIVTLSKEHRLRIKGRARKLAKKWNKYLEETKKLADKSMEEEIGCLMIIQALFPGERKKK